MSTEAIIVGIVLLGASLWFTFAPVFRGNREIRNRDLETRADNLKTRLERIIDSIHDLDFDFDTGKIPPEVYVTQRKLLVGRGVSTLMRLDEVRGEIGDGDDLEQLIARRRRSGSRDHAIEAAVAQRREA